MRDFAIALVVMLVGASTVSASTAEDKANENAPFVELSGDPADGTTHSVLPANGDGCLDFALTPHEFNNDDYGTNPGTGDPKWRGLHQAHSSSTNTKGPVVRCPSGG